VWEPKEKKAAKARMVLDTVFTDSHKILMDFIMIGTPCMHVLCSGLWCVNFVLIMMLSFCSEYYAGGWQELISTPIIHENVALFHFNVLSPTFCRPVRCSGHVVVGDRLGVGPCRVAARGELAGFVIFRVAATGAAKMERTVPSATGGIVTLPDRWGSPVLVSRWTPGLVCPLGATAGGDVDYRTAQPPPTTPTPLHPTPPPPNRTRESWPLSARGPSSAGPSQPDRGIPQPHLIP
jgi:hypothetical protein